MDIPRFHGATAADHVWARRANRNIPEALFTRADEVIE